MMRFLMIFLVFGVFASCGKEPRTVKTEEQVYYVEFVDRDSSELSRSTIKAVKRRLIGTGYYYGAVPHEGQWIRGMGYVDSAEENPLGSFGEAGRDEHLKKVHRFRDISEYDTVHADAQKIVITYNKRNKERLLNFDFHFYKKTGRDEEWRPVFNPGNFRYSHLKAHGLKPDLVEWMSTMVVKLTFK